VVAREGEVSQRLLDRGCGVVIGPVGSEQALASFAVTQGRRVLQVPYGSAPSLADPDRYPGVFLFNHLTPEFVAHLVEYLVDEVGLRRIGLLCENTAYGRSGRDLALAWLRGRGIEPCTVQDYEPGALDFTAEVASLQASGSEGLALFAGPPAENAFIVAAMFEAGYSPVVATASEFNVGLAKLLPQDTGIPAGALARIRVPAYRKLAWSPGRPPAARQQDFVRRVAAHPDADVNVYMASAMPWYDALWAMKQVAEAAGSLDFDTMVEGLEALNGFDGITGDFGFRNGRVGISERSMAMTEVTDLSAPESLGWLPKLAAPG
jgi:ABC-type branched-subunit amino acid transport system substrate-binding protein